MKAFLWLLVCALLAALLWGYTHPRTVRDLPTTASVRDSIQVRRDTVRVQTTEYVTRIKRIPADTLGPILRALAARPVIRVHDTLKLDSNGVDTGCVVSLTCSEARRLVLRDTLQQVATDSTAGDLRIQTVRADSLANRLGMCLADRSSAVTAYGRGFLHGAATGAGVCIVIKAAVNFLF